MSNWIELKKSLPKVFNTVLICTEKGNISTGYLSKRYENIWTIHEKEMQGETIIAWQPIPEPLIHSKGNDQPRGERGQLYLDDFSKDEQEIGEKAFADCHDHIKKVIHEYLTKDEITYEIWSSIYDATKSYLEENFDAVSLCLSEQLTDKLKDIEIKFNLD